jgi:hypothetical protein
VGVAKFSLLSDSPPRKLENYSLSQKISQKIRIQRSQFVIASVAGVSGLRLAYVRFGSQADIEAHAADVRFTPESKTFVGNEYDVRQVPRTTLKRS